MIKMSAHVTPAGLVNFVTRLLVLKIAILKLIKEYAWLVVNAPVLLGGPDIPALLNNAKMNVLGMVFALMASANAIKATVENLASRGWSLMGFAKKEPISANVMMDGPESPAIRKNAKKTA